MNEIILDELRKAEVNLCNAITAFFCAVLLASPVAIWFVLGG